MTLNVGINGFGRIGRAILRIAIERDDICVVAINDINPDIKNIAYLIKYDTTYGKLRHEVHVEGNEIYIMNASRQVQKKFRVYHQDQIANVPWQDNGVDVVVDASGVKSNLLQAKELKKQNVKHCVVTNAPDDKYLDRSIIMGANHDELDVDHDFVISSSICDANAFVPVMKLLDENFGVDHGFLTTLHPWLNYQNLLDGPSISYATPGQIHDYYALGRASTDSLIPKTTSAISASCKVLKNLEGKFLSMSFRIPTMIVSTGDIAVKLNKKTTVEEVKSVFERAQVEQKWKTIFNNKEAIISADLKGNEYSAIVDHRWIMMNGDNYLKMVVWYDNEWGYSYSTVELLDLLNQKYEA